MARLYGAGQNQHRGTRHRSDSLCGGYRLWPRLLHDHVGCQARQWAWGRFYKWQALHPTGTGNQPVVLRFRVRRCKLPGATAPLDEGLDELASLAFVLADYHYEDYWSLVQHCRQSTPAAIHDHRHPVGGWYDLVSGPVAAFWEQRVAMDDADQFSFHTEKAVRLLNVRIQEGLKAGPNGDPDYYTWHPVTP